MTMSEGDFSRCLADINSMNQKISRLNKDVKVLQQNEKSTMGDNCHINDNRSHLYEIISMYKEAISINSRVTAALVATNSLIDKTNEQLMNDNSALEYHIADLRQQLHEAKLYKRKDANNYMNFEYNRYPED